ncbi:MAG: four helix bundle protein [Proteobacteria bacterium]|nr:four helix bundle protein [Pseudomonadota bacterium]
MALSSFDHRTIIVSVFLPGNGKRAYSRERRRFFQIALGSLAETSAALDLALAFGLITSAAQDSLKSRLQLAFTMIEALP